MKNKILEKYYTRINEGVFGPLYMAINDNWYIYRRSSIAIQESEIPRIKKEIDTELKRIKGLYKKVGELNIVSVKGDTIFARALSGVDEAAMTEYVSKTEKYELVIGF